MSDSNISLLRAILKIGGGMLLTKGLVDSSQLETISAGVIAIASVIWGYYHRSTHTPTAVPIKAP